MNTQPKEFLHREVTFEAANVYRDVDGNKLDMRVTRSRTSDGFFSISIRFGAQLITLDEISSGDNNTAYEQAALELAELIDAAACHPCELKAVAP